MEPNESSLRNYSTHLRPILLSQFRLGAATDLPYAARMPHRRRIKTDPSRLFQHGPAETVYLAVLHS